MFLSETDDKGNEINPLVSVSAPFCVCVCGCATVSGQIDCYVETQWEQPSSAPSLGKDSRRSWGKSNISPQFVL